MNPAELRRLSRAAAARIAEHQRQATEQQASEEQKRRQRIWDEEWVKAREAAEELESTVRRAANCGSTTAIVYTAYENLFLSIKGVPKKRWFCDAVEWSFVLDGPVPEYAQHVYNSCPRSLSPRWVVWKLSTEGRNINAPCH